MAINFNSLPTEKPAQGNVVPKGQYIGLIKKAEMRQGKDETKPPYLNLEVDLTDPVSQTAMGKIWVILTESESPLPRYQLSRFIQALELPISGNQEFELKDFTKMVIGKEMLIDVTPEERKDGKEAQRSVVDVSAEIFYPILKTETTPVPDFPEAIATPTDPAVPVTSRY
jgi:hypothetical protein